MWNWAACGADKMINKHWGGVVENITAVRNEFGVRAIGAEAYVWATWQRHGCKRWADWVEYMTRTRFAEGPMRRRNGRDAPCGYRLLRAWQRELGCGGNMRARVLRR